MFSMQNNCTGDWENWIAHRTESPILGDFLKISFVFVYGNANGW